MDAQEMMKRMFIGCSVAGGIGVLLGYLGLFLAMSTQGSGTDYSEMYNGALVLPSSPGKLLASKIRGGTYCCPADAWGSDKHLIAVLNGAIYLPFGLTALFIRRKRHPTPPPTVSSSRADAG